MLAIIWAMLLTGGVLLYLSPDDLNASSQPDEVAAQSPASVPSSQRPGNGASETSLGGFVYDSGPSWTTPEGYSYTDDASRTCTSGCPRR